MTAAQKLTAQQLARIREMATTDTIYKCRNILDFNYTKDEKTGEVRRGSQWGISSEGPHKEMADFLDDEDTKFKMLQAPRGSLKSTLTEGWLMRKVLGNPNLRVLYGSETYSKALWFIGSIKQRFEGSDKVKGLFGDQVSSQWSAEKFTVKGRSVVLREPTFSAFGPDKAVTGGHYDIIVLDDLVSWNNIRTAESMQKVMDCFKMVMPLLDPGGILLVIGTRYHEEDLYGLIENEMNDKFAKLIIDCGFEVELDEHKQPFLVGAPRFAHLTKDFLEARLVTMGMADFQSQYLNRISTGATAIFRRDHFRVAKWRTWMSDLAGYIVTDTATSQNEDGCHSVVGLIGLDKARHIYLLDLRVGHFKPQEFVEELFDMLDVWNHKVHVKKVLFEKISLVDVFQSLIEQMGRERCINISGKIKGLSRHGAASENSKVRRIKRLAGPFEQGKFIVVDTVPRTYLDLGKNKVLFDPGGHKTEDGACLPGGDLVNWFIQFPQTKKRDVPDALADIEAVDNKGNNICKGPDLSAIRRRQRELERNRRVIPVAQMINGRKEFVNLYPTDNGQRGHGWSQLADRIPG